MNESTVAASACPPLPETLGELADKAAYAWAMGNLTPRLIYGLVRCAYEAGLVDGQLKAGREALEALK